MEEIELTPDMEEELSCGRDEPPEEGERDADQPAS